ncbi:CCD89 protein, partial [Turnix velox]|nr:CCD89 protein [Turnix velox]
EEKSQKALLHSRLEQQNHMICLLKKKADDTRKSCRDLEQLDIELEKLMIEDALKMKTLTQEMQELEQYFMDLTNSHEKLTQFKNGQEKGHMQLLEETKMLFEQTVKEKEAEVLELTAQAKQLSQQLGSLQEKCASESRKAQEQEKELLEARSQQANVYAWEVHSLKTQLQHLQEKHRQTVGQLQQAESQQWAQGSELQAKLLRANEEKERLLALAMEQGKALQSKQREVEQLEKQLVIAKKARQKAGKYLMKEAAAMDHDLRVQELPQRLRSSREAYDKLSLQFDACRKHSMEPPTKEKAVNVRLHHFHM